MPLYQKKMYSSFVLFFFIFLFWSASGKPCGSWNFDKTHNIILTHPVQEEIILLTFIEEGADDTAANPVQSDNIPADDGLDEKLSGEIVDSAANKGISATVKSDPLPSNATQEISQLQTFNTTEKIKDAGFTTESATEE